MSQPTESLSQNYLDTLQDDLIPALRTLSEKLLQQEPGIDKHKELEDVLSILDYIIPHLNEDIEIEIEKLSPIINELEKILFIEIKDQTIPYNMYFQIIKIKELRSLDIELDFNRKINRLYKKLTRLMEKTHSYTNTYSNCPTIKFLQLAKCNDQAQLITMLTVTPDITPIALHAGYFLLAEKNNTAIEFLMQNMSNFDNIITRSAAALDRHQYIWELCRSQPSKTATYYAFALPYLAKNDNVQCFNNYLNYICQELQGLPENTISILCGDMPGNNEQKIHSFIETLFKFSAEFAAQSTGNFRYIDQHMQRFQGKFIISNEYKNHDSETDEFLSEGDEFESEEDEFESEEDEFEIKLGTISIDSLNIENSYPSKYFELLDMFIPSEESKSILARNAFESISDPNRRNEYFTKFFEQHQNLTYYANLFEEIKQERLFLTIHDINNINKEVQVQFCSDNKIDIEKIISTLIIIYKSFHKLNQYTDLEMQPSTEQLTKLHLKLLVLHHILVNYNFSTEALAKLHDPITNIESCYQSLAPKLHRLRFFNRNNSECMERNECIWNIQVVTTYLIDQMYLLNNNYNSYRYHFLRQALKRGNSQEVKNIFIKNDHSFDISFNGFLDHPEKPLIKRSFAGELIANGYFAEGEQLRQNYLANPAEMIQGAISIENHFYAMRLAKETGCYLALLIETVQLGDRNSLYDYLHYFKARINEDTIVRLMQEAFTAGQLGICEILYDRYLDFYETMPDENLKSILIPDYFLQIANSDLSDYVQNRLVLRTVCLVGSPYFFNVIFSLFDKYASLNKFKTFIETYYNDVSKGIKDSFNEAFLAIVGPEQQLTNTSSSLFKLPNNNETGRKHESPGPTQGI